MRLIFFLTLLLNNFVLFAGGEQENPMQEKKDSVVVATSYDATSLDPDVANDAPSANVQRQIYNRLAEYDEQGELIYRLATSIDIDDDITYRVKLREGVFFHNGEELTAEDLAFSIERTAANPANRVRFSYVDLSSLQIEGRYTLSFSLNLAFTPFFDNFRRLYVLNKKAVEAAGEDYGFQPVGTGAYRFVRWDRGAEIELERFENFWGEAAAIRKLLIRVIPENSSRVVELQAGTVDIAYNIPALDIKRIEEDADLKIVTIETTTTTYLGFNTQASPLNNKKLRHAIKYALNIPEAVQAVFRGLAEPAVNVIPPSAIAFDKSAKVPQQNVEYARQLMQEAGFSSTLSLKLSTNSAKERSDMATIIKEQLKAINIDLSIDILEWGVFLERLRAGEQQLFLLGSVPFSADADNIMSPLFHSTGGGNFSRFRGADELIAKSRLLPVGAERNAIFVELQRLILEESPWIPLALKQTAFGVRKNLQGLEPDPALAHVLYHLHWS